MKQEFQTQCINEQNILGENITWATVQAEKSRELLESTNSNENEQQEEEVQDGETLEQREMRRSRLSSNNPFAEVVGSGAAARSGERKTEEEIILEKILLAHSEVRNYLDL